MARPREFDEEQALERAMRLFWRNGYEATTLGELLSATGLSKSSLYGAFGDKRSVFMASLEAYRQRRRARLWEVLTGGSSARQAIESFFNGVIQDAAEPATAYGCMVVNEAVELGPHDEEIRLIVAADFDEIEDAFVTAIARGQDDGSIGSTTEPRKLARFLTTTLQGMQVMVRARSDQAWLEDAVGATLTALDAGRSG